MEGTNYRNPNELNSRIQFYQRYGKKEKEWYQWVSEQIDLSESGTILEVGCGSGSLWEQGKWDIGHSSVILTDRSPEMVLSTKEKLVDLYPEFEYSNVSLGDDYNLPFNDKKFDVVIANHVLHLVDDLDTALKELHRVLKPGGSLYTSTKSSRNFEMIDGVLEYIGKDARMNDITQFDLEIASERLNRHFDSVDEYEYTELIQVDNVDALMWFIESKVSFNSKVRQKLRQFLENRIESQSSEYVDEVRSPIEFRKQMGLLHSTK